MTLVLRQRGSKDDPSVPPFSGENALYLQQQGANSISHLYTPVFDLRALERPVLEFNMHNLNLGHLIPEYVNLNLSYSVDGGAFWHLLDTASQSFKSWYYHYDYQSSTAEDKLAMPYISETLFDGKRERMFVHTSYYQSGDTERATRFIVDIAQLKSYPFVRFHFNAGSRDKVNDFHILIDDFQLSEAYTNLEVEYEKNLMESPLSKSVRFFMDISNTGNYMADSSTVSFYLSKTRGLDGAALHLGM